MTRKLAVALLVTTFLAGCSSVAVRPTIQDTEIINAPFDTVWSATVNTLAEQSIPVKSIDKVSGHVTTNFVNFAYGNQVEKEIDDVAVKPSGWMHDWSDARYMLSIFVTKNGDNETTIKITTHIEAFENNIERSWMVCYSNGVIEKQLFVGIKKKT
ncbi:MAG: hypothetical protein WAO19_12900 [Candidatus Kryptoniota bacterium]